MPYGFKEPRKVPARGGSRVMTFLISRLLPPHCLLLPEPSPLCWETTGSDKHCGQRGRVGLESGYSCLAINTTFVESIYRRDGCG